MVAAAMALAAGCCAAPGAWAAGELGLTVSGVPDRLIVGDSRSRSRDVTNNDPVTDRRPTLQRQLQTARSTRSTILPIAAGAGCSSIVEPAVTCSDLGRPHIRRVEQVQITLGRVAGSRARIAIDVGRQRGRVGDDFTVDGCPRRSSSWRGHRRAQGRHQARPERLRRVGRRRRPASIVRGLVTNTKADGHRLRRRGPVLHPRRRRGRLEARRLHGHRPQPHLPGRRPRPAADRAARADAPLRHRGRVHRAGHGRLGAAGHHARRHPGPGHGQRRCRRPSPTARRPRPRPAAPPKPKTVSAGTHRAGPAGLRALRALAAADVRAALARDVGSRCGRRSASPAASARWSSRAAARRDVVHAHPPAPPRQGHAAARRSRYDNGRRYKATRTFRRC